MKEGVIQNQIRLALSKDGVVNFRNNTGMVKDPETGRVIRFGLCKGSSDVIGITPVVITQDMVGKTVGVFTAVEVKTKNGRPSKPQLTFIDKIKSMGGFAGIARSVDEALKIVHDR